MNVLRVAVSLAILITPLAAQDAGRIEGAVVDDKDKPVQDAYIVVTRSGAGGASASYGLGKDGTFAFGQLGPGTYSVCVQSPDGVYLDPCTWSTPRKVTLAARQVARNVSIAVATGARLRLRFSDPEQRLRGPGKESAAIDIEAGIWLPTGLFVNFPVKAKDGEGQTLELQVPRGVSLHLQVASPGLVLEDEAGRRLEPHRTSIAVRIPSDRTVETLRFTVHSFK